MWESVAHIRYLVHVPSRLLRLPLSINGYGGAFHTTHNFFVFMFVTCQVGWADSLSHRLYLFHKAMEMVAADSKSDAGDGDGDLPRAGEMMGGLGRQSETLAVFLGLEDAPDGPAGENRCLFEFFFVVCFFSDSDSAIKVNIDQKENVQCEFSGVGYGQNIHVL